MAALLRAGVRGLRAFLYSSLVLSSPFMLEVLENIKRGLSGEIPIDYRAWLLSLISAFGIGIVMALEKWVRDTK